MLIHKMIFNNFYFDNRYQSRKRRPFSRYTARADKVRREKSFATGSGVNFEEQLNDIRGNLVNIQTENNLLKRDIGVVKGEWPSVKFGKQLHLSIARTFGKSDITFG